MQTLLHQRGNTAITPVFALKIMQHFVVNANADSNNAWWRARMRDAKRYKLESCRGSAGQPGKKDSSMWFPERIAGWLVDKRHMSAERVSAVLRKHFPECADYADMLDFVKK